MDNISIKRLASAHPKVREDLSNILIECEKANTPIRYIFVLRTTAEQTDLYNRYKAGGPKAAPPGLSYHEYGLAVDFCLYHKDGSISFSFKEDLDNDKIADWTEVLNIFKKYGWINGASFGDNDHCEKGFGYTVQGLEHLKEIGQVDKDGYVII